MGILSGAMYLQVYTVGPDYAHAEARKSPALDGKVERDSEGKEIRYPVMLTAMEKLVARKVCVAFKVKGGPLVGRLCRSRRGAGVQKVLLSSVSGLWEVPLRTRVPQMLYLGGAKVVLTKESTTHLCAPDQKSGTTEGPMEKSCFPPALCKSA